MSYNRGAGSGPGAKFQRLLDEGLVEIISAPTENQRGRVVYRLTPDGITAARILHAKGDPPEWAANLAE